MAFDLRHMCITNSLCSNHCIKWTNQEKQVAFASRTSSHDMTTRLILSPYDNSLKKIEQNTAYCKFFENTRDTYHDVSFTTWHVREACHSLNHCLSNILVRICLKQWPDVIINWPRIAIEICFFRFRLVTSDLQHKISMYI